MIAARDWSVTPLGPIDGWPAPLTDTLSMMLSAPLPMVFFWGLELIALYNDAYAFAIGGTLETADAMSFASAAAAFKCTRASGRSGIPSCDDCLEFMRTYP